MATNKKATDSIWSPAVKLTVIIAAIVLVLAIAFAVVAKMGVFMTSTTAMTVGDTKITALEFNYNYYTAINTYYAQYYNYFYYYGWNTSQSLKTQTCRLDSTKTWYEYFVDITKSNLEEMYLLYNVAQAQNFQMTEKSAQLLEDYISDAQEAAKTAKMSVNAYLRNAYGKGMTLDKYREFLTHRLLVSDFYDAYMDGLTYADDELEAYYEENQSDYDKVTYRYYTVSPEKLDDDASDEEVTAASDAAKEIADKIAAAPSEEEFLQLVEEEIRSAKAEDTDSDAEAEDADTDAETEDADDEDEIDADEQTLRERISQSNLSKDYSEWLLDEDRKEGDTTVIKTESGDFTVLYFIGIAREEYPVANMRHILLTVTAETDEEGNETSSDDEEQKKAAEDLLAQWKAGEKTEDSFAALVADNTDDTASAENGGLYEDVYKGYMVKEINEWLWAEGRKEGDCEIVKTDYGYHLVYFVGYGEEKWSVDVTNAMKQRDYEAQLDEYRAKTTITYNDRGISLVG